MSISTILAEFEQYYSVSTDTREVRKNDVFFALKGDNFDGNQFAAKALEAGASIAVVDDAMVIPPSDYRYILVEDVLRTLQKLATVYRRKFTFPVIGITGTNGKTTTKELVHAILSSEKRVHSTKGNLNNHIGVPLTLLSIPLNAEIAIVEMGANKKGDISELAAIAEPDYGMITNIGYAHLERFGDIEGVTQTKGELFEFLRAHNGCGWVNEKDSRVLAQASGLSCRYGYGGERSTYRILSHSQEESGMNVSILVGKKGQHNFFSHLVGSHNAENILAAVTIGDVIGISLESMKVALSNYKPRMNRSQLIKGEKQTILLDAYNANPSSMEATLRSVASRKESKVGLILGDMYELGSESSRFHEELIDLVKELLPNSFLVGVGEKISQAIKKKYLGSYKTYLDIEDAIPRIQTDLQDREFILIKGSRGVALERVLPALGVEM